MNSSPSFAERVEARMASVNSLVCVGLDPVMEKLPSPFEPSVEDVVHFCQGVIEATLPYAAAFKPNLGFFAALGRPGLNALWAVRHSIPSDVPVILDCKVGDVGETARAYAHGWFSEFGFDAITVNPYLGGDATAPFMDYAGKGVIILCKTSNPGSGDFQDLAFGTEQPLYLTVADRCRDWESTYPASIGLVVGATYPEQLQAIRDRVGDQLILLPGVGAQGGDLEGALAAGLTTHGTGLLCSASRSILYAGNDAQYDVAAARSAAELQLAINDIRARLGREPATAATHPGTVPAS